MIDLKTKKFSAIKIKKEVLAAMNRTLQRCREKGKARELGLWPESGALEEREPPRWLRLCAERLTTF